MTVIITEHPDRDAPAGIDTPYRMRADERFRGTLDTRSDEDWIRMELAAGQTYTITLGGIGPGPVTDTVLTVYEAGGNEVAYNDDVNTSAREFHSRVTFTPESSGTYYLSAAAYTRDPARDHTGRYELRVYEADAFTPLALTGTDGDDTLIGPAGGGPGEDVLNGGDGDDALSGGPGADILSGGPGGDTAWYGDSGAGVTVNLATGGAWRGDARGDTFGIQRIMVTDARGSARELSVPDMEHLHGSAHDDTLTGNILANTLDGDDGDDVLDGAGGNDWLSGGPGADVLVGGDGFDAVSYAASPAGVTVRLHDGTARGGHAEGDTFPGRTGGATRTVTVSDIEYLDGSGHDDTLAGDRGHNRLEGRGGNDTLDGREGDDRLEGEAGADILIGGPGQDTASYRYSDAGVIVRLHDGTARGGHAEGDTFGGRLPGLTVTDGDGTARRVELPDIEHLRGSEHDDILAGDIRDNRLHGGGGNDALYGGPDGGDDTLHGGNGHDRLYGGKGNDTLHGGRGNDTLRGGADDDTLSGGDGDDAFVFAPANGADTVLDFGRGEDTLDLGAFGDIRSVDDLVLEQRAGGLVIELAGHGGGTITLTGIDRGQLTGTDFLFFTGEDPLLG